MRVKARRGVCIGVDRHLKAGDLADLDAAQVQFLVSIGSVEVVPEEAAEDSTGSIELEQKVETGKKKK